LGRGSCFYPHSLVPRLVRWLGVSLKFPAYVTIRPQPWQPVLDKITDSPWGTIVYALTHIVDFSNLLDICLSEPLADEIDGRDQTLDAKLRIESASSPPRDLEKAVFGGP
jgi:hypothetical protein